MLLWMSVVPSFLLLSGIPLYGMFFSFARSCPTLETPGTGTHQAPLSMGFPRQEYWSGLSFPSPGDLPEQEIEPKSLHPLRCRQVLWPQGSPLYRYILFFNPFSRLLVAQMVKSLPAL